MPFPEELDLKQPACDPLDSFFIFIFLAQLLQSRTDASGLPGLLLSDSVASLLV